MGAAAPDAAAELVSGEARALVLPERGAALLSLSVGGRPVLRPSDGPSDDPFAVALIVLAPYSNRVSRPFAFGGATHALPATLAAEPYPLHGDAFLKPWRIARRAPDQLHLELDDGRAGPLRYSARLVYHLGPRTLTADLALTSRADSPLPFGIGFHPWFPRDEATRLGFEARAVWQENERHLPVADRPSPIPAAWDFAAARPLPDGWINNGFAGWDGTARIEQGHAGVPVTLRASAGLDTLIVYSPSAAAGFFCAEPVSHPVDAFNLDGQPGLAVLEPGETLRGMMELDWGS